MTTSQETPTNSLNLPVTPPVPTLPLRENEVVSTAWPMHPIPGPCDVAHDPLPLMEGRTLSAAPLSRINNFLHTKFAELRQQTRLYRNQIESYRAFTNALLTGPLTVGAVCPSSPHLAQAMAHELDDNGDGLVLELGAGTGSITSALLQRGITAERLIVLERSPELVNHLRRRFPSVRVIQGDASQLDLLLGSDGRHVQAIVSGLPLRSLARTAVKQITRQMRLLLPTGGRLVQFTYDLSRPSLLDDESLRRERTRVVWKNLPPARVDTFVKQLDGH